MNGPLINSRWKEKESDRQISVGFRIFSFETGEEYVTFKFEDDERVTFLPETDFMEKFDAV